MEKKKQDIVVVDIYNVPTKLRNRRIKRLKMRSAPNAIFDAWEGSIKKAYIPREGVPGYQLKEWLPKLGVKVELY